MRNFIILLAVVLSVFLVSCENREPLSWESDIFLPILDDRIGWLEYVDDTLLVPGEGVDPAKIVFSQPIEMISGSLAPVLPDTSIEENIGIGIFPFQFQFRIILSLFKTKRYP